MQARTLHPLKKSISGILILLLVSLFFIHCSYSTQHRILTLLFDGVPPLEGPQSAKSIEPVESTASSEDAAATQQAPSAPKFYSHPQLEDNPCASCHDMSNSYQLLESPDQLCLMCHDDKADADYVHAPVEEGSCTECHNPHGTPNPQFLVKSGQALCFTCHDEESIKELETHEDIEDTPCWECHNPHNGGDEYFLSDSQAESPPILLAKSSPSSDSTEKAATCYADSVLMQAMEEAPIPVAVLVEKTPAKKTKTVIPRRVKSTVQRAYKIDTALNATSVPAPDISSAHSLPAKALPVSRAEIEYSPFPDLSNKYSLMISALHFFNRQNSYLLIGILIGFLFGLGVISIKNLLIHKPVKVDDWENNLIESASAQALTLHSGKTRGHQIRQELPAIVRLVPSPNAFLQSYSEVKNKIFSLLRPATQSVLFTGLDPATDVKSVVANFAISLAQEGAKVLIIDCDDKNSSKYLNLDNNTFITGTIFSPSLSSAKKPTAKSNGATVPPHIDIPAGLYTFVCHNPGDPKKIETTVKIAQSLFDYVLVIAPSRATSRESLALATLGCDVILVSKAEVSADGNLFHILKEFNHKKTQVRGIVINDGDFDRIFYQYKFGIRSSRRIAKRAA